MSDFLGDFGEYLRHGLPSERERDPFLRTLAETSYPTPAHAQAAARNMTPEERRRLEVEQYQRWLDARKGQR